MDRFIAGCVSHMTLIQLPLVIYTVFLHDSFMSIALASLHFFNGCLIFPGLGCTLVGFVCVFVFIINLCRRWH